MSNETLAQHDFGALLAEHGELMGEIAELRRWWDEVEQLGVPRFGEMGSRLKLLRDHLQSHFEIEEAGGYLAGVLAVAPRFSEEARRLCMQHRQLLNTLDSFIERLTALEPPFHGWDETREEFDGFLLQLHRHESAENEIIQSAFNQDAGTVD